MSQDSGYTGIEEFSFNIPNDVALGSMALSLKRIADSLDRIGPMLEARVSPAAKPQPIITPARAKAIADALDKGGPPRRRQVQE